MQENRQQGGFTGRHAFYVLAGFFGVIVAVNLTMAVLARSIFGGVVVDNSYVASQEYNGWLEQARMAQSLGWKLSATRLPDGRLQLGLEGAPEGTEMSGVARHPLGREDDIVLRLLPEGDGGFVTGGELPAGRWILRLEARHGDTVWRVQEEIR